MFLKLDVLIAADNAKEKEKYKKMHMKIRPYSIGKDDGTTFKTSQITYVVSIDNEEQLESASLHVATNFYNVI